MKQILLQKYINPYISIYYDKTCINIMDWYDHNNDVCTTIDNLNFNNMNVHIIAWFKSSKYYDYDEHYMDDEHDEYNDLIHKSIKDSPDYDKICKLAAKYHNLVYRYHPNEFYEGLESTLKIK